MTYGLCVSDLVSFVDDASFEPHIFKGAIRCLWRSFRHTSLSFDLLKSIAREEKNVVLHKNLRHGNAILRRGYGEYSETGRVLFDLLLPLHDQVVGNNDKCRAA